MANDHREWQCPPQSASENYKLGWLNEQSQDGQAWVKSQRGYQDFHKAFEILAGRYDLSSIPKYRSKISTARLKRNIKQVRGAVTNIRPVDGFCSENPAFASQVNMMNKVATAIYQEQFLDMSLKAAFDWAAATQTGFIFPRFRRNKAGRGKGSINFDTYGQPCVLPSQLPSDGDFQKAYAVSLLDEMPIYMAHGLFPRFQDRLYPTSGKIWYASEIRTAARGNLLQRVFGSWLKPAGGDSGLSDAYVPIRYTWVLDLALNETGDTLYMGDWSMPEGQDPIALTSWSYAVPSYGKPYRGKIADENDAMVYPYRRLIISSESCVMYDGPAFDWHGEFPGIPLCLDGWAFDPAGYSLVRDGYEIQQSLNEMERGVMDKNAAQLDMALAYDINAGISSKEANQFDPMQPRARVGFDGTVANQPFVSPVPPEVLKIDQTAFEEISHLEQTMDYQMGVNDIAAMTRARGLVATEGVVEKLLEANGPIVMETTRVVEWTMTRIGQQMKYLIPQYITVRQLMTYVGPDGITPVTYDFDPESMVPSHMPWEPAFRKTADLKDVPIPSEYSKQERLRFLAENIKYIIVPHSAHEMVQMAMKLGLVQLRKVGIQISSKTIARSWNIENFGGPDAATEYERYFAEQMDVAKHAIQVKQLVDQLTQQGVQITPAMQMGLAQLLGGQTQEGRPPSGQQAPQINSKDGGARSTISESGS